jgi:integrase
MMKQRKKRKTANDDSERKHLTGREIERLLEAAKGSRNEARDRCLLLLMFRHGLRVSEACRLKLDQVNIESRVLHVARLKRGLSTTQPLRGDELRAIGAWLKQRARMKPTGKAFFVSEQRPSPHAAPRLRLRLGRPRGGHAAHYRIISDIETFSTPSNTPPAIPPGSKDCGGSPAVNC